MQKKETKKRQARQRFEVLPGEGRRFSFSRFKRGLLFYCLLLLALVAVVQIAYHWLGEQYLSWRLQIVTAERGVLEQEIEVGGLITRREQAITAPESGIILFLARSGERVPVGKELARIGIVRDLDFTASGDPDREQEAATPAENEEREAEPKTWNEEDFVGVITIYSQEAGLLSHYVDGLESQNGPLHMTRDDFMENRQEGSWAAVQQPVRKGEPFLKLVDNWNWYYNVVLALHPGRTVAREQNVSLEFKFAPGRPIPAELYRAEIDETGNQVRLTYIVEKEVAGFDEIRWTGASLLYSRKQGIIVPVEAVFEKDLTRGVYLNRGGRVVFQPVTLIERQGDKALVEGLEPQSLVITHHELVEEGRRLN